jgi:hypothetical protein
MTIFFQISAMEDQKIRVKTSDVREYDKNISFTNLLDGILFVKGILQFLCTTSNTTHS